MNLNKLKNYVFAPIEQDLTVRDTILYALGLGYGFNPTAPEELQFLYEEGLKSIPSMSCVLGYPGFWLSNPELEVDWVKLLHGEHYYEIHRPLPVEGRVVASHRVVGVDDKGEGRGVVVNFEKTLQDAEGQLLATIRQSNFCRGDGGCGGFGSPAEERPPLPEGVPDAVHEISTSRQIALLYRLNGDYNPVHADPDVARKAGYPGPWIAGMCSMGLATRAVIDKFCDHDPDRIKSMLVRFRNVCFPGETLRFEFYLREGGARFRGVCVERDVIILDRGEVCYLGQR